MGQMAGLAGSYTAARMQAEPDQSAIYGSSTYNRNAQFSPITKAPVAAPTAYAGVQNQAPTGPSAYSPGAVASPAVAKPNYVAANRYAEPVTSFQSGLGAGAYDRNAPVTAAPKSQGERGLGGSYASTQFDVADQGVVAGYQDPHSAVDYARRNGPGLEEIQAEMQRRNVGVQLNKDPRNSALAGYQMG